MAIYPQRRESDSCPYRADGVWGMRRFTEEDHVFSVCAYGESPFLESCIESVLNQISPTRVIICTSTPNALIEGASKKFALPFFVNSRQGGIASDWNYAIDKAEARLVTIAHQDDIYCPDYSAKMLESLNFHADPLIFFSDYGEIKNGAKVAQNRLLSIKRKLISPMEDAKKSSSVFWKRNILRFGSSICCPSVTYNKASIPLPLFREGMKGGLDWEAWERLSRMQGAFCYDPHILMHHRIHGGSETSRIIADNIRTEEDLDLLKKFWPEPIAKVINRFYSESLKSNAE